MGAVTSRFKPGPDSNEKHRQPEASQKRGPVVASSKGHGPFKFRFKLAPPGLKRDMSVAKTFTATRAGKHRILQDSAPPEALGWHPYCERWVVLLVSPS